MSYRDDITWGVTVTASTLSGFWTGALLFHFVPLPKEPLWWAAPWAMTVLFISAGAAAITVAVTYCVVSRARSKSGGGRK